MIAQLDVRNNSPTTANTNTTGAHLPDTHAPNPRLPTITFAVLHQAREKDAPPGLKEQVTALRADNGNCWSSYLQNSADYTHQRELIL